jgi:hypothetical protein
LSILVAVICLKRPLGRYLGVIGVAGATTLLIALPWLYLAGRRYGTDLFASKKVAALVDKLPASDLSATKRGIPYWEFITGYWADPVMRSYVAWSEMPVWGSALVVGFVAVGIVGLLLSAIAVVQNPIRAMRSRSAWLHVVGVLIFPVLVIAASINSYVNDSYFGMQGRYLLPAFAVSVLYISFGIVNAVGKERGAGLMVALVGMGMGGLAWYSFNVQGADKWNAELPDGAKAIETYVQYAWQAAAVMLLVSALWYAIRGDEPKSTNSPAP